ncbi:MAG: hypothetical protein KGL31_08760 [candidate division NC10 bacterium]|nr:hypothetical protein [candidate division NC10 bacterium]MDE2321988.1 hypothetical protein [candidate division NC10 bacterium]
MKQDEVKQPDRSTCTMHADRRSVLRILAGGLFGLLVKPVAGWAAGGDSAASAAPRRPRPATPSPALFTGKLAETYRIAKEVPELIEQMPCYCGCGRMAGHQNNLDCYTDRHADT